MIISTNCTEDRKAMVRSLASFMGETANYLGMPSACYRVGELTVDKNAAIDGSPDALKRIVPFLLEHGYISGVPDELGDLKAAGNENEQAEAIEPEPFEMSISIPLEDVTPLALINILKTLYSRQALIAAMTRSDAIFIDEELIDLIHDENPGSIEHICDMLKSEIHANMVRGIEIVDNQLRMSVPFDSSDSTRWKHYSTLLLALTAHAKSAHHTSGKRLDLKADEEKYFCRNWMIQLGLGGAEHKETQRVLLGHLRGYAAFRSADQMTAHKAKYAAARKALREAKAPHAQEEN